MHQLGQMPTARPGFMTREAAAKRYAEVTGRSLNGFLFPRVLAIFKLGVVFQQLAALHGSSTSADVRVSRVNPEGIFAFGIEVAAGTRF
jgi:aminoglycoside phosphotransferase (APT) family kinase protein